MNLLVLDGVAANHSPLTGPWGTPVPLGDGTGDAGNPQLAVDSDGNVTAVWSRSDGTRTSIWANRFE